MKENDNVWQRDEKNMYQFFVEAGQINERDRSVIITGPDVNHIKNVLRMKAGEEIALSNGQDGREYRCGILRLEEDRVICELCFVKEENCELPARIYLFQALPKADKMEFVIQKAVELGVCQIIPVAARRCVVKLDEKKAAAKRRRWQEIALAAAKQSRRGVVPDVTEVSSFADAVLRASKMDVGLIPYELAGDMGKTRKLLEGIKPGQEAAVFIGPEGGFEAEEISLAAAHGLEPITLGKRILRTETAGLTILSWMIYCLEA